MNKQLLQERIAQYQADMKSTQDQINQLTANYSALSGAKQDCEYWLTQIGEPEEPTQSSTSDLNQSETPVYKKARA